MGKITIASDVSFDLVRISGEGGGGGIFFFALNQRQYMGGKKKEKDEKQPGTIRVN